MQIEFDPGKDVINRAKHGISLEAAALLDIERSAIVRIDDRVDYGEPRFIAYGLIHGRLHAIWFTWRSDVMRVIGLRKANDRERKRYEQQR